MENVLISGKPKIEGKKKGQGSLSLRNRNISSLYQIIKWYTDEELGTIKGLDLANNNLSDLEGIDRFWALEELSLPFNKLKSLPPLPKYLSSINLFGNKFETIDDSTANAINNLCLEEETGYDLFLLLRNNPFVDFNSLKKIDINRILNTADKPEEARIDISGLETNILEEMGGKKKINKGENGEKVVYYKFKNKRNSNLYNTEEQKEIKSNTKIIWFLLVVFIAIISLYFFY